MSATQAPIPVHETLRAERKARNLTQQQMATALGISRPAYTYIESGKRNLLAEEARLAAERLRIPISRLYRSHAA